MPTIQRRLRKFQREEDGSLLILAMFLFMVMFLMGGLAIDIMRYEQTRSHLQNTMDRSVLAAASLTQTTDSRSVVNDYFAKAGLTSALGQVTVTNTMNSRIVTVNGVSPSNPIFMPMLGINSLDAEGSSAARQDISNVEISLVLDVSGSMDGSKIAALRTAAANFVATVRANDTQNRTSISIVPYNAQVNMGATLMNQYNVVHRHTQPNRDCLELPLSAFSSLAIPPTMPLPQFAYADIINGTWRNNGPVSYTDPSAIPDFNTMRCISNQANIMRPPGQNVATLQSQINGLSANGNTSITLGMKWGMAMLDPASRPIITNLIAQGAVPATLAGRPFDYTDPETLKFVILMTDGEHVAHDITNDAYKTGISPVYRSTGDGQYSVFHAGRAGPAKFWVPHLSMWQATAYNSGSGVTQQTWQGLWINLRASYVAWNFYARALGTDSTTRNATYNTTLNLIRSEYQSASQMDTTLQQTCSLAKAQRVIVYGIAFQAPSSGQTQIRNCASGPNYYFNATGSPGLDISTAFSVIANNITQLKLTQ